MKNPFRHATFARFLNGKAVVVDRCLGPFVRVRPVNIGTGWRWVEYTQLKEF